MDPLPWIQQQYVFVVQDWMELASAEDSALVRYGAKSYVPPNL